MNVTPKLPVVLQPSLAETDGASSCHHPMYVLPPGSDPLACAKVEVPTVCVVPQSLQGPPPPSDSQPPLATSIATPT